MLFWKEVYVTWSMEESHRIRNRLADAGIPYKIGTNSLLNTGRSHGVPGIRAEAAYQYRIYVKRKDLAEAKRILNL